MAFTQFTRAEIRILAILATVQFAHIVDFMIIMPLGPQLMRLMQINPDQFSLLVSAYTFCAGATGLLSIFFLDRIDRKRSLLFFVLGFGIGTLACAMADRFETLLLARALTGAFGGILSSQVFAIVGDAFAVQRRGAATAIVMGAFSLASIFGVPLGLLLADFGSWHTPLFVIAGLAILIAGLIHFFLPAQREHLHMDGAGTWAFIRTLPQSRRPLLAMSLMVSMVLGQFAMIPFLSPSLVANTGLLEANLPLIYLVGGLASIVSSPLFGRWVDRFGAMRVFFISASFSILPFLVISHLPRVSLAWALLACALFFVSMGGRMVPTMTFVTGSVLAKNRGAYMSLVSAMQQFAAALGAWLAGHIVTRGANGELLRYAWVGYWACILTLVALFIGYSLRHEPAQVKPPGA